MSFTTRPDGRMIIALVATRGRNELLLSRSLPSILKQSRLPDRIVVVLDQSNSELDREQFATLKTRIQSLSRGSVPITVLRNVRVHPRAAGAWNTGIDHLHRNASIVARSELCYVAILDDDDAWEPNHIDLCLEEAMAGDCGMVAAGLIRHDTPGDQGQRHSIPDNIDAREQFIRGQHIQGSNLFVRLDVFLKVGGFDEHLPSCTDRDLCIRLARLDNLRFGRIGQHTVHHFADQRPDRLSTSESPAKLDGLTRFWRKHADCFDEAARADAASRARERFGWILPEPQIKLAQIPEVAAPPRRVEIVAGFVTDAKPGIHVKGLMGDLLLLASNPGISKLKVIVIENGPLTTDGDRPLHALVEQFKSDGLDVHLVSIEQLHADWAQGLLVDTPSAAVQRLPIAVTRTILNTYVVRVATELQGAWAWILDDDKRLEIQIDRGDGSSTMRTTPDLAALCALQDAGVDVVIGPDSGAAPLPFAATLRVQLVDMEHTLQMLTSIAPSGSVPDRSLHDAEARRNLPDSYYDLSRHTEHLETPFSLPRGSNQSSAGEMLAFIASKVDRLMAGESIFRPLQIDAKNLLAECRKDSIQRGGSTVFFKPTVLSEYPQTLARIGNRFLRRSDMLISQLMRDQLGLKIVMHPAAGVRHDRSTTKSGKLDRETLREDVLGYALYRAADEVMQKRPEQVRRNPMLAWNGRELNEATRLVHKYIEERLAAVTLNGWRIVGLAEGIRTLVESASRPGSAWASESHFHHFQQIATEMRRILGNFKPAALAAFAEEIRKSVTDADIRAAFSSMDGMISQYKATLASFNEGDGPTIASRERRARLLLKKAFHVNFLRLLGAGGEGIVFTDEKSVYKVFDFLKSRPNHDTLETLTQFQKGFKESRHLFPLECIKVHDGTLLIVYPYEPSEPYTGGRGTELVALLKECKDNGIVCRNIHPKNLRVSKESGLKLIDYGSDIRPFSDDGFRSMAERAWLSWRWVHRTEIDLDQVMRRALIDKSLPEMDGFERFWLVIESAPKSPRKAVSDLIEPLILASSAKALLDYGCGKAALARSIAGKGIQVTGFDLGSVYPARWDRDGPRPSQLLLTTERATALRNGPFDAVVCSLVLCELCDQAEYQKVLTDIGTSVTPDGLVYVAICHPSFTFGGPTPLHTSRTLPQGATYLDCFAYTEQTSFGAGPRKEFHRPLSKIRSDLLQVGLHIEETLETQTVDTERFEPSSDFLVLVCRPIGLRHRDTQVSLTIKTCIQESATIERQVEHLVSQLESPRPFHEKVLVVDSRKDDFLREYAAANAEDHAAAVNRLVARGLIDRVVHSPTDLLEIADLNRRWFGVVSSSSHTREGAPVSATLAGFESCVSDYVLQVDSDLMISRHDPLHDYLGEMIEAMVNDDRAVTTSMNIAHAENHPFTATNNGDAWRVEVRGAMIHRPRLLNARPFPNDAADGAPTLTWHRSVDKAVMSGGVTSLRGGDRRTFFVHPPNLFKRSTTNWMATLDFIERGEIPECQIDKVDLAGGFTDWVPRRRNERFVFVLTGRKRAARSHEEMFGLNAVADQR